MRLQNQKLKIKNQNLTSSSKSSTMEQLLARQKSSFVTFRKGDTVKGKITKITPSEILVDIDAKTHAVVLEKDKRLLRSLLSLLKVGDEVTVTVLNPESDLGHPVVSLRRFLEEATWKKLEQLAKEQKKIEVIVAGVTRGGFLATTKEGVSGFLPNSQSASGTIAVGQTIPAFILELDRLSKKVIFSQKTKMSEKEFEGFAKKLKRGEKVEATVTTLTPFGVFVSVPLGDEKLLDGLIHISEISWDKVSNVSDMFVIGETKEAVVIGFDKKARRVDLSIKRLTLDPFEKITSEFRVDQRITGKVSKILPAGVVLELDGVEGFIRKEKIPPNLVYEVGQEVKTTVSEIDLKRHRIVLTPVLKEKPIGYR